MTSLVEFIEARLAEDEQVAREASEETWVHDDRGVAHGHPTWTADYQTVKPQFPDGNPVAAERIALAFPDHPMGSTVVARHIARHDPARVLREVESKRRIVEWASTFGYTKLLEELALPYRDHPDYQEEWAS